MPQHQVALGGVSCWGVVPRAEHQVDADGAVHRTAWRPSPAPGGSCGTASPTFGAPALGGVSLRVSCPGLDTGSPPDGAVHRTAWGPPQAPGGAGWLTRDGQSRVRCAGWCLTWGTMPRAEHRVTPDGAVHRTAWGPPPALGGSCGTASPTFDAAVPGGAGWCLTKDVMSWAGHWVTPDGAVHRTAWGPPQAPGGSGWHI